MVEWIWMKSDSDRIHCQDCKDWPAGRGRLRNQLVPAGILSTAEARDVDKASQTNHLFTHLLGTLLQCQLHNRKDARKLKFVHGITNIG